MDNPSALGFEIEKLVFLKEKKAQAEAMVKSLAAEIEASEANIIQYLKETNIERATHAGYTAAAKTHTYPHAENWDTFYEFVYENRYIHLLEKRIAVLPYRELLSLSREVPGVVPFDKLKLSLTKAAR